MKKNKVINALGSEKILYLLLAILFLCFLILSISRRFTHDEFEAVHTAWKILNGEQIYTDFLQTHHPLFYYLLAPLIGLFGENEYSIISIRLLIFFMLILISVTTYLISVKLFNNKRSGIISIIFLLSNWIFYYRAIEIRPDVPQVLAGLLAVYFIICFFDNKQKKYLYLSAICLAISFLFLQKAIFLGFAIFLILVRRIIAKDLSIKILVIYGVAFLATIFPIFLYWSTKNGMMEAYIKFNWILNLHYMWSFSAIEGLKYTFLNDNLLWLFFAVGTFLLIIYGQIEIVILSTILLASILTVRTPHYQYYMMAMPFVAIVSSFGINNTIEKNFAISIILIVFLLLPIKRTIGFRSNNLQLEKIDYVLSLTKNNDYVYDGDIWFNLFRRDLDFFWFSVRPKASLETYKSLYSYDYNIYNLIAKYKPKVISNYYINMEHPIIMNHYEKSDRFNDIFLRKD